MTICHKNNKPWRTAPHSLMAKVFHWSFIVFLGYGWVNQVDEVEELEDMSVLVGEILFALVFLAVLVARFVYMRLTRPGKLPRDPTFILRFARLVHVGLYVCPASLALSGLAIGGLYAASIKDGIALEVVLWLHEASYWASVNLIVVHIVGAIYHRCLRDGVWSGMVPVFKETKEDSSFS